MANVVKLSALDLKDRGFKKRRYGFNRHTSDGLVHVVHFWMAPFEPPAWTEVPGLRERRYGGFRLDFGVWVPEMARLGRPRSDWINEYDCQLRATIGRLISPDGNHDFWWDLHHHEAAAAARAALHEHGLQWLDRFPTKAAIVAAFEAGGPFEIGMSPAGALDIADLYTALARDDDARRTLERYVDEGVLPTHASYLAEYLLARGCDDLVPGLRIRP